MDAEQWSVVEMVLGTELLARVCGPFDDGAQDARLTYLVLVVQALQRTHGPEGIRAWFQTSPGEGHPAAVEVLSGRWDPQAPAPQALLDAAAGAAGSR
ncbi:MAG: hypothetical protein M3387_09140 [Actinomycetota bacterium]|nr:hypothetical protein [Actinomycetota bacterium]